MKKLPYPKKYASTKIYIKVPKLTNGIYEAVNVLENGKTHQTAIYKPFVGEHSCQSYCNTHNQHHNWSKQQVKQILKQLGYESYD